MSLHATWRVAVLFAALGVGLLASQPGCAAEPASANVDGAAEAQPREESRTERVLEIRSYNLKPGTVDSFETLFHEEARPLLDRWGIDVVAYGRSLHDASSWILLRAFDDLQQRARLDAFYGSDEWRSGPRDPILDCIESYTTVVLPFDIETVERIRRSLQKD